MNQGGRGWIVPSAVLTSDEICYSAGLGEDGSFDLELANTYHCKVFAFDPTPRSLIPLGPITASAHASALWTTLS
jgi:hypothetical protein